MELIFAALGLVAVVLLLRWLLQPRAVVQKTFWLCQDGQCAPTGPYTVAQIVSLWQQGQITARGMVMAEGADVWLPILAFADRIDSSVKPERSPLNSLRLFLLLIIVLVVVALFNGEDRTSRSHGEQLRNAIRQPNIQSTLQHVEEQLLRNEAKKKERAISLPPPMLGGGN